MEVSLCSPCSYGNAPREELLQEAQSKIGYLKMVTPRDKRSKNGVDTGRFVYDKNGIAAEGNGKIRNGIPVEMRNYTDAAAKHQQLMNRQHFGGRGNIPPPTGPQW
jgi:hypothetical protein